MSIAEQSNTSHILKWKFCKVYLFVYSRTIFDEPDSIRGRFGLTDTRNCAHGSGLYANYIQLLSAIHICFLKFFNLFKYLYVLI